MSRKLTDELAVKVLEMYRLKNMTEPDIAKALGLDVYEVHGFVHMRHTHYCGLSWEGESEYVGD